MNEEINLDAQPEKKSAAQRYHDLHWTPSMTQEEREKASRSAEWKGIVGVVFAMGTKRAGIASFSIPAATLCILSGFIKPDGFLEMVCMALGVMTIGFLLLSQELWEIAKKAEADEKKAAYWREMESIAAQEARENEE